MIGLGDKVIRTKGFNSGMKPGDVGTVMMVKKLNGVDHVKIREYSNGWHSLENLRLHMSMFNGSMYDNIDWTKVANKMSKMIKGEESKRNKQSELETLKKQRKELDCKIKYLEENMDVKIDDTQIQKIVNNSQNGTLLIDMTRKGRTITCVLMNDKTKRVLGKGIATAMPTDTFNLDIGCELAYCRALENFYKRKAHKVISLT